MKAEPKWIPAKAIIDLHAAEIAAGGGAPGLQNQGLLDSALARPKQKWSYDKSNPDIAYLSASYGWGLCRNHPFVDGNKRIAFIAIGVFLGLNNCYLDAREEDAYLTIMKVAEGSLSEEALAEWIRKNSLKTQTS
jgi:death-on-curing protein